MSPMQVVTLATSATLPQARVLARSLQRHQPSWPHDVLLVGRGVAEDSLRLRSATEELGLDLDRLLAYHDDDDLATLLVPRLLQAYTKRGVGPVLHLPASAWVLSDLEPVATALASRSVLLVPRMIADIDDDGLAPTRPQMERAGRIAETIMGVDGTAGADGFLAWWARRLEAVLGPLEGSGPVNRPATRQWLARLLELAPARFSTAVLDDPGCNLNQWNLHTRTLTSAAAGVLVDERWPLRFLDLPGFEPDRPFRLAPHASRVRVSRAPVLRELCASYATEVEQAGWHEVNQRRNIGRELANGLLYDETICGLHAHAAALGERFGDVFSDQGARAFASWLEGPAPEGAAYGITRYVFYRVVRERPDVTLAYPDLDGADGPGYVGWCWVFGQHEMTIPDRFMPPRSDPNTVPRDTDVTGAPRGSSPTPHEAVSPGPSQGGQSREAEPTGALPAVRVTGYLSHALGLGAAARAYARALDAAGLQTSAVSVPLHHLELPGELAAEYGLHEFEDLIHEGLHGFEIVAVNADELPAFVDRLGEDYFQGPRIGIWGWETNSIPSRWQSAFGLLDEIWVYSRFMAENIGAVSPIPVITLPPPVQSPARLASPLRLGVPDDGFLFLFVFDYMSTIQRKNPVGLIEAFKHAFAPGEGPQLLIKTINAPLRPLAEEEVLWAAHGRRDIRIVDRSLSGEERDRLMSACDCYVSLHRAEGFGLTLAEAMAIGKPVIATGYSGNLDFMNSENSYLVDYEISLVGPDCEIYPADGEWAEPNVEHAAELMRRVVERPEEATALGARAREDIARELSPQTTGAAMRRRLEELSAHA
jgi:glycosyltransferase involved in cell wall biosynthesis